MRRAKHGSLGIDFQRHRLNGGGQRIRRDLTGILVDVQQQVRRRAFACELMENTIRGPHSRGAAPLAAPVERILHLQTQLADNQLEILKRGSDSSME
jgi:hypothetical protein